MFQECIVFKLLCVCWKFAVVFLKQNLAVSFVLTIISFLARLQYRIRVSVNEYLTSYSSQLYVIWILTFLC
jgi:hypothetical protein